MILLNKRTLEMNCSWRDALSTRPSPATPWSLWNVSFCHSSVKDLYLSPSDLPGEPVLDVEGDMVKGEEVVLTCRLDDRGHPEASEFVWMK